MDINKKNIAAAFGNLDPTEEQKERIYENILNAKNAENSENENVKKITSGRFRRKRAGSVIAAAAAVLTMGTLSFSALGLIDLQSAFGRIFDKDVNKLEAITTAANNYVTEGDDRLSLSLMAVGGTETEAIGAIKIVRNDGGSFPEKLVLNKSSAKLNPSDNPAFTPPWVGMHRNLTVVDDTTAVFQFRIFAEHKIIGKDLTLTFSQICDDAAFSKASDSLFGGSSSYSCSDEEFDKALNEFNAVLFEGNWSITFPLEYNSEYLTADTKTTVKIKNRTFSDTNATVTKVMYSAISADITFEGADPTRRLPEVCIYFSDGSRMKVTEMNGMSPYDEECVLHCSFDYPVDINDIEKITVNGTPIKLK